MNSPYIVIENKGGNSSINHLPARNVMCHNEVIKLYLTQRIQSFNQSLKDSFLTLPKQALVLTCLKYKSFENTVGK